MVFSSLSFLFMFLPAALLLYFLSPRRLRNLVLFISSLVFYAWGEPVYIALILFSTVMDYVLGILVDKYRGTAKSKYALIFSVAANICLLGVFKYADFIAVNIGALFGLDIPLPNLPLPIGISFYTFQTMSYTIDVYRGSAKVQKNFITYGTYVAMFPQLTAGPIIRYQTVAEQLESRREDAGQFAQGIQRFTAGLGKKVLLANNIGMLWSQMSSMGAENMSVLGAWLGITAFAFQIYFDFSGYSDMAIGLAKMFGFTFLENFDYPYISKSVTEFWRRWHISLGTWFREYVYIPLGGNRKGLPRQLVNIAAVWLLTGIWHGASWNFAVWGAYFMVLLILEKLFLYDLLQRSHNAAGRIYTLLAVLLGWVIFAFDDFSMGIRYFMWMLGGGGIPFANSHALFALSSNAVMFIFLILASTPAPARWAKAVMEKLRGHTILSVTLTNATVAAMFLLCVAYLVDSTYNPFLYFRF
ncbi:MAG: MBOAT family protein [Oscillospiraceae bacterium]|nr:MBOAT family protein [Oscillospiraceae bacterium]